MVVLLILTTIIFLYLNYQYIEEEKRIRATINLVRRKEKSKKRKYIFSLILLVAFLAMIKFYLDFFPEFW